LDVEYHDGALRTHLTNLGDSAVAQILLIDDDESIRAMLAEALEEDGHSVRIAANGREGIELYTNDIDLVITDIVMPEQEGIQTIMELRKTNPDVKIIAMSGGGRARGDDYLNLARKFGALQAFSKPLELDKFLEAVKSAAEETI
jgi:DNA-binding NtrC family response regulator